MLLDDLLLESHQGARGRHAEDFRLWRDGDPVSHYCLGLHLCKGPLNSLAMALLERGLAREVVPTGARLVQVRSDGPAPRRIEDITRPNIIHVSQSGMKLISIGWAHRRILGV